MDIAALPQREPVRLHWRFEALRARAEAFLEAEREQLALWAVVGLGGGIAAWLSLPGERFWTAFMLLCAGSALGGGLFVPGRLGRAIAAFCAMLALGTALIWIRSEWVAAPRLERTAIAQFEAKVERIEQLAARDSLRLLLRPADPALPPLLRVNMADDEVPDGLGAGATIRLRARLTPPMPMPLPGAHDYARDAWFAGIGGTGRALGKVEVLYAGRADGLDSVRAKLDRHVRSRLEESEGAIATALATGDQGAMPDEDAEAMRRSGLAHLLSVSGLHIAAAVGAAFLLTLRLLALSERLALRLNLVLIAAGGGALAGVAYTLLTGAQVPTVRSCIAAILVLVGIALGREALSLRLIAVGAVIVLAFRPEALAGASFQLSFAAVTAIVGLYQASWFKRHFERREEGFAMRVVRAVGAMFLTGLAVEIALMPLALYHFHKAGLYGVVANLIAIPLTTFVIMPAEALALLLDLVGLGGPMWVVTGWSIGFLLGIAHWVAGAEGAVAMLPAMPAWAFAAMVLGVLWLCLWSTRVRRFGLVPIAVGAIAAVMAPRPDLLVTGDGRHLALIDERGVPHLLRARAGDFVRDMLSESAGFDGEALELERIAGSDCSRDACVAELERGGRRWALLATRSTQSIDWAELTRACAESDIVVSDRRLPRGCQPKWLKLDRSELARTGGLTIYLSDRPRVETVADRLRGHPWAPAPEKFTRRTPKPRVRFPTDR